MQDTVKAKVEHFFGQYSRSSFKTGELIMAPEQTPAGVYCLTEGLVRCYSISKTGVELTLNIFKPLSFFPVSWAVNEQPSRYYYEALASSQVYCAPKEAFKHFISSEHEVAFDLLQRIYRGLDGYMLRMEALLAGDAYIRTVTSLVIHALRFGGPGNPSLPLQLTQAQLAAQTGLSRETVTREIKKLRDKQLIAYHGKHLVVLDLAALEREGVV